MDPMRDKEETLRAVQLAEVTLQRLQHALPLLEQKHRQCLSEEYRSRWAARHLAARQKRDVASESFGRLRELQDEMLAILQETAEVDKLIDSANSDRLQMNHAACCQQSCMPVGLNPLPETIQV